MPRLGQAGRLGLAEGGDVRGQGHFAIAGALPFRQALDVGRIAEIKESVRRHVRVVEDAVEDLELGDGAVPGALEPGLFGDEAFGKCPWGRPVALAEDADEIGATAADLLEADRDHLDLLIFGDAPAKVDIAPDDAARFAESPELREDELDQLLAFRAHVAEGRGDKDPDDAVGGSGGRSGG